MPGRSRLREVKLTLPMAPDMEVVASQAASSLAAFIGMSPDRVDEVRLAVVEACINAFEHSGTPDHKVEIKFRVASEAGEDGGRAYLEVDVLDNGHGFDPSRVTAPQIGQKLRAPHKRGWGLRIIRSLMDDVRIVSGERGTMIVMRKYR